LKNQVLFPNSAGWNLVDQFEYCRVFAGQMNSKVCDSTWRS